MHYTCSIDYVSFFVLGRCGEIQKLTRRIVGYSAAMDFVLAILPWKMIMGLQMNKREKIGVVVALSMGIMYVQHSSSSRQWYHHTYHHTLTN